MVQLVVKAASPESGIPEWMLIEMQGQLECSGNEQLAGNFIGDLHFNKKGLPIMIIGHHILYGKVSSLDKPYIVLIKNTKPTPKDTEHDNSPVSMETDQDEDVVTKATVAQEEEGGKTDVHYKVSAAIKRKIVFRTRPKPIITYVPKKGH
ncbi:chromosome transmission fidelity protein 8 homolog [Acanthaster planci]|uniref:Chromosome transmission fidelity protein 8 homolog n=1 Tax=Acanthaster planci TaxID=133434 RepID=A0A8B7YUE8_ACAPL|nr:chromosome transmission fidelity protein 8 homolog [Acanthaster planci]